MEIPECFYIEGTKTLIFRREKNEYITFDPNRLEFLKLNIIGAEIMYLISINFNFEKTKQYFIKKYGISKQTIENDINCFLSTYECIDLIYAQLKKSRFV